MNELLFIIWIASGSIHSKGITSGFLGWGGGDAAPMKGCASVSEMKLGGLEPHLFTIRKLDNGFCDWGCESPVIVKEVECKKVVVPSVPATERLILKEKEAE